MYNHTIVLKDVINIFTDISLSMFFLSSLSFLSLEKLEGVICPRPCPLEVGLLVVASMSIKYVSSRKCKVAKESFL